jgi:hypothetical protein
MLLEGDRLHDELLAARIALRVAELPPGRRGTGYPPGCTRRKQLLGRSPKLCVNLGSGGLAWLTATAW